MPWAVERVHRDEADRRILAAVLRGRNVTLARLHRHLHGESSLLIERAYHEIGVQYLDIVAGLDDASSHLARPFGLHRHPLGPLTVHTQCKTLEVQHDVGHVFSDTLNRREFVQDTIDLNGCNGGSVQRRQENAPQRVTQCQAESALQRFRDHRRPRVVLLTRFNDELVGFDKLKPILLIDAFTLHSQWRALSSYSEALSRASTWVL